MPRHDEPNAAWDQQNAEPNNRLPSAYQIQPGYENALTVSIEGRSNAFTTFGPDIDWYRFNAVEGRTYTIEIYDVDLPLGEQGYNTCSFARYTSGMTLAVHDPTETTLFSECTGDGAANTHINYHFTAGRSGWHYFATYPNNYSVNGQYKVRVLPKHNEPGAGWDIESFEPNNRLPNAYSLNVGEALQSQFEAQNISFATFRGDIDWFYFNAVAGKRYRVEVTNVDPSLNVLGYNSCLFARYTRGVTLFLYDPTATRLDYQCSANDNLVDHNSLTFVAGKDGPHYIRLYPNANVAGTYTVQVLEVPE